MIRGLILTLAFFIAGCQSVPTYHRYENPTPKELKQVAKGTEIRIFTTDNKNIAMKFDSVTEDAVIGYVTNVYDIESDVVELGSGDGVIDSVSFESIDLITARDMRYKLHETFVPTERDGRQVLGCIVTLGLICGH